MTSKPARLTPEQRRERANNRYEISLLIEQVRSLSKAVGRTEYEQGVIPKPLRRELEETLNSMERQLWDEWKTPTMNSEVHNKQLGRQSNDNRSSKH